MPIVSGGTDKRSQIFQAAIRVFSQKGYHGATVDDLAAQAGVAKGTIYNYFRNKADLFTQLYTEVETAIWSGVEAQKADSTDPLDEVRRCFGFWCQVFQAFGQECPLILEVWSTACCHPDEHVEVRQCLARTYERTYDDIGRSLARGVEAGVFAAGLEPELAARSMTALFDGLLLQCLVEGDLDRLAERGPAALELLLSGFLAR